ncbi:acyltransferase family protein [Phyllobacterium meliloti]|uniref:acyltransferase family protein n=1 Tax=Phyllobacterium meliloti TaxID=555317 RepID=UPI001D1407D4|nr:acyltransferase [Phyllobacterium sp. T1293]UGX84716.1 acyltransferase [Phyllobacterium sp. T1293]
MEKNTDIEALRAIALFTVISFHVQEYFSWRVEGIYSFRSLFSYWGGVDLFFCVSGFIIAKSVAHSERRKSHRYFPAFSIPFWIKRAFRLWPAAWFWLFFVLFCSAFLNRGGYFGSPLQNFVSQIYAMTHVANLYFYYCRLGNSCGVNSVYWSLSLEEQFYFFFPFVFFFIPRKYFIALALVFLALMIPVDRGQGIYGSVRIDAILIGVLIAFWSEHKSYENFEPTFLANKYAAWITAVFLTIVIGIFGSALFAVVPPSASFIAFASGVLVLIASYNKMYICGNAAISGICRFVGARTYSLYLSHIPAAMSSKELLFRLEAPQNLYVYSALGLIMTLVFSEFSYRLIEEPIRRLGRKIAEDKEAELQNNNDCSENQPFAPR